MTSLRRALLLCLCLGSCRAIYAESSRFDQYFSPGDSVDYGMTAEPAHDGAPRILQQSGQLTSIIHKTDSTTWSATARGGYVDLSQSPVIPVSGLVVPDSLWNVQGGLSYLHKLGDRHQWGASLGVGSASDELFHSIHETELQATASYIIPSRQTNSWLFLLNYSNNRAFLSNIPLPGFAYIWRKPDDGFQAAVGFPFLELSYHPNRDWGARVTLFGTTNQVAEVDRRIAGPVQAYLRYDHNPLSWLRAHRDDNSNHLIYDEKKSLLGLKSPLGRGFSLDVAGGWTFDRRFFESRDAGHTNVPQATLANGWLVTATLSLRWGPVWYPFKTNRF